MLDLFINLVLTGYFLKAQAQEQLTLVAVKNQLVVSRTEVKQLKKEAPQLKNDSDSSGVDVTANSVIVVDDKSNKVLFEKNCLEKRSIASITKLMTALVFLDLNPGWDNTVTISSEDQRDGNIAYLIPGEKVSVRDLFHVALIASSNEGAVALARITGLSHDDFVKAMNDKAKSLGMNDTQFADVTGLDDGNISTAADLVILAKTALSNQVISDVTSNKDYQFTILNKGIDRKISSTDKILGQEFGVTGNMIEVEAGKTGHLEKAGYCFVSKVKNNENKKIIVVVLGSETLNDRFNDTKSIAYWVFNNYIWQGQKY
ncbi:MAG: serine hydrolase [bacterium]